MKAARLLLGAVVSVCMLAPGARAALPEKPVKRIVPYQLAG